MSKNDLTGRRFGSWLVIGLHDERYQGGLVWNCRCDCGKEQTVRAHELLRGRSNSCGCSRFGPRVGEGQSGANEVLYEYRTSADLRGYVWNLTDEAALDLMLRPCDYCGQPPSKICRDFCYNGIDRVDNKQGYTLDNTVPCCHTCNIAKGTLSASDFIGWAQRLVAHQEQQP